MIRDRQSRVSLEHARQSAGLYLAYISQLTPKSCLMYSGLRLARTFVFCCPDQFNKRLADSKIESVRRLLPMYARSKNICCVVYAIPEHLSFVVVLPYKNVCGQMYAGHYFASAGRWGK